MKIEDQGKKQIKATEDHEKQLVESNELIKKDFNIDRDSVPHEEQKKIFNELIRERSSEFHNSEERINPNNLIYKNKTEGMSPKDFSGYQNPIDLLKNLRDGNINLKEVLKNQINFKSNLCEIQKNLNLKSKDQISVIQNVDNIFDLREKIIDAFRDYPLLLHEAKY